MQWPFASTSEFVQSTTHERIFSERLDSSSSGDISLHELILPQSRLVSGSLFDSWTSWATRGGHALSRVDLSRSGVTDSDLVALLRVAGSRLISLSLKGCERLGSAGSWISVSAIAQYSGPTLQHFATWEHLSDSHLGSLLPSLRQLRFLDLSLSKTPLSAKVFESLPMVRYLDLSLTQAALDKAAFRSWLARAGNELECLLLARPPSNAGPEFACDDEMLAALGSSSPSLALLDVSYCRTLTSRGLRSRGVRPIASVEDGRRRRSYRC